jgi:hypothetical protein
MMVSEQQWLHNIPAMVRAKLLQHDIDTLTCVHERGKGGGAGPPLARGCNAWHCTQQPLRH